MKKIVLLILLLVLIENLMAQSLSPERVKKIKSSIVRISIGDTSTGTGFFINKEGDIATCWHVIAPAVHKDNRGAFVFDKVEIKTESNEKDSADIYVYFLLNGYENANVYDYCILKLVHPLIKQFSFFKIGSYKNVKEGDAIYSCGYPLSYQQNFLSIGMCSTKYSDTLPYSYRGINKFQSRDLMLIDMTLNKGNSGSPIIKLGSSVQADEIVGIFDFINNPLAGVAEDLEKMNDNSGEVSIKANEKGEMFVTSMDAKIFSEGLKMMPTGINGCISIDYLQSVLNDYK